jgi:hypothetical protein
MPLVDGAAAERATISFSTGTAASLRTDYAELAASLAGARVASLTGLVL